jgi:signal transduction histidine kinase
MELIVKRLKMLVGLMLAMLTGGSMLVTNFVILIFWAGDILNQEGQRLQQQLLAIRATESHQRDSDQVSKSIESMLAHHPQGCAWFDDRTFPRQPAEPRCAQGLRRWVSSIEQQRNSSQSILLSNALIPALTNRYVYAALPLVTSGNNANSVVAVAVPVSRVFASLWNKERIIAVYLVFNACILTALAFFRFYRKFIVSIDTMVREADAYHYDDALQPLFKSRPASEFEQLTRSIQAMVSRIETDKGRLTVAVKDLANKNALLQENQRQMIRTEKMATVGRLGAGLAHEIGNPLSVVQGYLQLLQMEGNSEQDRIFYTTKALEELGRVDVLIRKLLDFARTTPGMPMRFDIHGLLADVVEGLQMQPSLRDVRLELVMVLLPKRRYRGGATSLLDSPLAVAACAGMPQHLFRAGNSIALPRSWAADWKSIFQRVEKRIFAEWCV